MRGVNRFTYLDTSRNNSGGADTSPSRQSSSSMTGSASIQPISSDSSPNTATPESIRQFDPEKFFGDMNLSGSGIDVTMNMGQGLGDDGGVEFFSDMLGVQFNGN
jgi:hypothetical protein